MAFDILYLFICMNLHALVMALRPSPKNDHHHLLITRFHPTSGPHDLYLVTWSVPLEFTMEWPSLGWVRLAKPPISLCKADLGDAKVHPLFKASANATLCNYTPSVLEMLLY